MTILYQLRDVGADGAELADFDIEQHQHRTQQTCQQRPQANGRWQHQIHSSNGGCGVSEKKNEMIFIWSVEERRRTKPKETKQA